MLEETRASSTRQSPNAAMNKLDPRVTVRACTGPVVCALGSCTLAWAVVLWLVPNSSFSAWDDWAYARGALAFIAGDGIHYYGWASMPELGQWLWAWPFVKMLGPSPATLRIATIASAIIGLLAFYYLVIQCSPGRPWLASFVTASLGLCPLFFWLSGTFMTDVPSLAFSLVALACYDHAWRDGAPLWLLPAAIFACLTAATRQTGLAVPVAAALMVLSRRGRRDIASLLAVVAPLACGLWTLWWFNQRHDTNPMALNTVTDVARLLPLTGLDLFLGALVLGICSIPLLVLAPAKSSWPALFFLAIVLTGGAIALTLRTGQWSDLAGAQAIAHALKTGLYFPYMGNTLPDGFYVIGRDPEPMLIRRPVQFVLTAMACVAGAWLIASLVQGIRTWRSSRRPLSLLAVFTVIQALILPLAPRPYDRYYLALIPGVFAFLGAVADPARLRWKAAIVTVLVFGLLCIATTRDWFTWTAATWTLGQRAMDEHGMAAKDIEAGTAWDGWHSPRNAVRLTPEQYQKKLEYRGFVVPMDHFLFPDLTGKYALSLTHWPQTRIFDSEPFRLWLFSEPGEVYLLEFAPDEAKHK
jgi:4-amino-4-deoxy-L-arabinose transferase-like glycosyltransferase